MISGKRGKRVFIKRVWTRTHDCSAAMVSGDFLSGFFQLLASNAALTSSLVLVLAALFWSVLDRRRVGDLDQKHVFITGCDSGFGNLLARRLDRRGVRVIAACLTPGGAAALAAAASPALTTVLMDVTDTRSVARATAFVRSQVGERGLWGLVNNAGRALPMGPSPWLQVQDFRALLEVNLLGPVDVTLQLLEPLAAASGRVVNVSSVLGRVALAGGGYCPSKYGLEAFSDSLRRDLHHFGVKVSIIEPGFFRTAVTRLDLIESDLRSRWSRLPQDVRARYGAGYLDKYLAAQARAMRVLCSSDLTKVTSCMEHALTARRPRTRYSAGWDARLLWLPLAYLPAPVCDVILRVILPAPEGHRRTEEGGPRL